MMNPINATVILLVICLLKEVSTQTQQQAVNNPYPVSNYNYPPSVLPTYNQNQQPNNDPSSNNSGMAYSAFSINEGESQYNYELPTQQKYQPPNTNKQRQQQDYYNLFTSAPLSGMPTNNQKFTQTSQESSPCVCAVFLSGQFSPGNQPVGNPALTHEQDESFGCSSVGTKQCTNKCLEVLVKHLSNSPTIICGTIDRDCHKEKAYLFVKNCNNAWVNTNLSAGREYCCKDGEPYKCPRNHISS